MAIGDGANDVNMICAAHIGIGIRGLEGAQAASASDFSIGQFRFLKDLMFVHGREAYRRNSYAVCYTFYKNFIETTPIWLFGCLSMFSSTFLYNLIFYYFYNVVFTCVPIIWFATFDFEYSKDILRKRPKLYWIGINDRWFNKWQFLKWFSYAIFHSTLLTFLTIYTVDSTSTNEKGRFAGLYVDGTYIFTMLVFLPNVKILINSYLIEWIGVSWIAASVILYIGCLCGISFYFPEGNNYGNL